MKFISVDINLAQDKLSGFLAATCIATYKTSYHL